MPTRLHSLLKNLHDLKGSDLHLASDTPPFVRLVGDLVPLDAPALTTAELLEMLAELTTKADCDKFLEHGDLDFAYELPGVARYRVNYYRENRGIGAAFREIPQRILSLDELGLPAHLGDLAMLSKGIVLVTGPTGSGKSTTLASLIDHANKMRKDHIITIEEPIEFIHQTKSCLVNQREVGRDTATFASALRAALREDPDILLVGEMRDLETISLALEAAETGHLVFATLHTSSAAKTIDRIIEVFSPEEQPQIRASLSESIQAILSQTLLKRQDVRGRVPAIEILLANPAVRNLIREGKSFQLPNVLQTSRSQGMCTLDDDLERLLLNGVISPQAALVHAQNKQRIRECVARKDG